MRMGDFFFLIPLALAIGAVALGSFLWALRSSQYEDLDGAAERILFDDDHPASDGGLRSSPDQGSVASKETSSVTAPRTPADHRLHPDGASIRGA